MKNAFKTISIRFIIFLSVNLCCYFFIWSVENPSWKHVWLNFTSTCPFLSFQSVDSKKNHHVRWQIYVFCCFYPLFSSYNDVKEKKGASIRINGSTKNSCSDCQVMKSDIYSYPILTFSLFSLLSKLYLTFSQLHWTPWGSKADFHFQSQADIIGDRLISTNFWKGYYDNGT